MTKHHHIRLNIINNSASVFTFEHAHLEHGELADGYEWPQEIAANSGELSLECYETEDSVAGCSGWVKYTGGSPESPVSLYFSFSNPVADNNGIGVGTSEEIYQTMDSKLVAEERVFPIEGSTGCYLSVYASSTDGETNNANWVIDDVDTNVVIPANPIMLSAKDVFNGILKDDGVRTYYNSNAYSVASHFKGAGAFNRKMIFTHTNVFTVTDAQGIYLIGNKVKSGGNVGDIKASYNTVHNPPWGHPGGTQVCGSYMAVSLQADDHNNESSEIQIYDIRHTEINQPMRLLIRIEKDRAINGVGMTKEIGEDGRYIVIAGEEDGLSVYRSKSSTLEEGTSFELVQFIEDKNGNLPKDFHCGGSGFGMATQEDGSLFIFTMHGGVGKSCTMGLYSLTISNDYKSASVAQVKDTETITMKIPGVSESVSDLKYLCGLGGGIVGGAICNSEYVSEDVLNTNFRWGKGLNITSPTSVEVFATDRNVLPNLFSDKNFGVVTWVGTSIADVDWGDSSPSYTSGSKLAIAMVNNGHCVEMPRGSNGSDKLYHIVGKADFKKQKISWGTSTYYHTGSDLAIAMDNNGHCVEVHRGDNESEHYYAVGKIDFSDKSISWGDSKHYDKGSNLAIAMDDYGYCIEVHRGSDDSDSFYYHVGKIDFDKKTITWSDSHKYGNGSDLALAMDNHGNCIEIHRGADNSDSSEKHYYRVGKLNHTLKTIVWGDSHHFENGSVLSVAMHNNGNCVAIHRGEDGSDGSNNLYYCVGKANFNDQTIDWDDDHKYTTGSDLSIAMDNKGNCIEVHRGSEDSTQLYYKFGVLIGE